MSATSGIGVWYRESRVGLQSIEASSGSVPLRLKSSELYSTGNLYTDGKVGINTTNLTGDHDLYVNGSTIVNLDTSDLRFCILAGRAAAHKIFVKR